MLKHHADFAEVALAVTPRDEDLYAYGKAHRQSGEDEVIQARHHGGAQLDGAEVTQESGVGEGDDGLRQVTQHDGVSDAPDLAVRYGGFNHAAKIGIYLTQNSQYYMKRKATLSLRPAGSANSADSACKNYFERSEKKALPRCSVMSEAIKASCPISSAARSPARPWR